MKTGVKINLGLHILGRREDGFHELETIFVPSDWYRDDLTISLREAQDLQNNRPVALEDGTTVEIFPCDWDPKQDLTLKAYKLLKEEFKLPPVNIRLHKQVPVGAGLGGGSADAAASLIMLNQMFDLALSQDELAERAARLGSDCAFFIYGGARLGRGRGELLSPIDIALDDYEIRISIPDGESVSTAEAYKGIWDVVKERYPNGREPLSELIKLPIEMWQDRICNDFELTILPHHPRIAALKQQMLDQGAIYASMTGSGAAVYGLFKK